MDACLKFSADSSLLLVCIQDSLKGPHFYVWDIIKKVMSYSFKPGLDLLTSYCAAVRITKLRSGSSRIPSAYWKEWESRSFTTQSSSVCASFHRTTNC